MDKKKIKVVFTFGILTDFSGKVVIIECDNIMIAIDYMFKNYDKEMICSEYHYNEESLKNGCLWKKGLFEKIKKNYDYGKDLIKKYNYEIIEHKVLD